MTQIVRNIEDFTQTALKERSLTEHFDFFLLQSVPAKSTPSNFGPKSHAIKSRFLGPLSFFFGLFLIVALLLSSVEAVVFNKTFYQNLYTKLDWANQIQVSQEDLEHSIFMMVDYVQEKRDDLEGEIIWKGKTQSTFNSKEIRHMKDVRDLWLKARNVMYFSWIATLVCGLFVITLCGKQSVIWLFEGLKASLSFFFIVLMLFGFWWIADFTGFWTWFHTIVFPGNQDWLLNPATDFMIVICPEEMFSTMIFQIALRLILRLSLVFLGFYGLKWWMEKSSNKIQKKVGEE